MNSTSQTPEHKFSLGSGPNALNNKSLYLTLVAAAAIGFLFTLALYASWSPNRVSSRLAFGIFVSLLPACAAFLVLRFTRIVVSWQRTVLVYFVFFFLLAIVQAVGREVTIYR